MSYFEFLTLLAKILIAYVLKIPFYDNVNMERSVFENVKGFVILQIVQL